jgi:PAS domain S-box-containing protein
MKKKYLISFYYAFLICTLSLLAACTQGAQPKEAPRAIKGLLDLTQWNFDTDGPVKLSGEWGFYWKKILKAEDVVAEPRPEGMTLIRVPGTWNGLEINGKKISGSGYATYRLRVLLRPQKSPMAFKFLSMGTAFDLYVNGKEVSSAGIVGTTRETMTPEWLPHITSYTPESDQLDLILHLSNFNHRKGGAVEVIEFGTEKGIRKMREQNLALDLFLCGSMFIMCFYHFVLFLNRKKDRAPLYLSIFCLLIAIYGLLSGERYFAQIFPGTSWEFRVRLTNLTSFMSVPVFLSFIHSLYPQEFKRAFLNALSIPLILLSCAVVLTPARVYSYLIPVFHIITLISAFYTIYVLVLGFTRKREGSFILLAGTCMIVLTMVNDVLYDNTIIGTGQFIDVGMFFFIFSQSVLLSTRFSKAFETVENQTHELTRTNLALEQEIQERKKMEEALKVSEEKYRLLAENATDVIWTFSLESLRFTYVSPSVLQMRGYTSQEALELTLEQTLSPESLERAMKTMQEELTKETQEGVDLKRSRTLVLQQLSKDGTYRWAEATTSFIRNSEGKPVYILGVTRDITERKRTDEEKRSLEERLNRAEKMEVLGQLAGGVAHDLNNVLGVLSGYSELLLDEIPEGHRTRGYVEKILQSTEKGAAIIQDLLTLARRGVNAADVLNLNSVVSGFLKTPVFEKIQDYNPRVTFRTECDKNLLNIKGSPVHLEKTLMNLVSNAAESISGNGEVMIRTENRYLDKAIGGYDEVKEGDYAVLTVSDTGMGIPAENREKIFEPFYTKKTMGRSGTGLGLAIVWGTVKDHNGYIDVQTEVGEGTIFTLYFPVTREEPIAQQQKVPIERYMGNGESVLVVDDIAEQRDIAARLLTRLGYQVHVVSGGEEAVEYLKVNKADILVLDMIMAPGIDGLETYQRILEINPKQRAIIVSGFSETERVREAQKLGAGAYVKKPYIMEKIGAAIRGELLR